MTFAMCSPERPLERTESVRPKGPVNVRDTYGVCSPSPSRPVPNPYPPHTQPAPFVLFKKYLNGNNPCPRSVVVAGVRVTV